jgi:Corticotropin-releasing factor family.
MWFSQAARRVKRTGSGPSLSIVNPLDVLRQRLLLEIARRRMRQTQNQIQANRDILESIGKREVNLSQQRSLDQDDIDDLDTDLLISSTEDKTGHASSDNNR